MLRKQPVLLPQLLCLPFLCASRHGLCGDAAGPLPEGRKGIAVRYSGDEGIERDSNVIFVETFD